MKLSRNGGTPVNLTSDEVTSDLVTDGTSVYWSARTSSGGRIAKISVNGGAVTVLATKGGGALVRRNSTLYYIDDVTNDLYKVGTGGGASTLIATGIARTNENPPTLPPLAQVSAIATDGVNVYGATRYPALSIFKASVNGGSPAPKATYVAFHEATRAPLVVDSSNVYFAEANGMNGYLTVSKTAK
jgi:hypothetical protein